jgi:cytochrome c oxidase subunit II
MMYTLAADQGWLHKLIFRSVPGSDAAAWSDALFMMIFWFSVFFFVLLMGLMVYWTIKYRRRPGVPAPVSPHHNTPLEIIWTVVPSSALLVIFLLGFQGYMDKMVAPTGALELQVTAFKWGWNVTYPNGASSTEVKKLEVSEDGTMVGNDYPVFYVPENTAVSLRMSSQDVIHAFWIPDFRTKMDVYPNRYTGYVFHTPVLGMDETVLDESSGQNIPGRDMWVFCAEYCGDEHSRMAATLRVVPQQIYERKIEEFKGGNLTPVELGALLYKAKGCAVCHSVDGAIGTGPTWKNLFGYEGQMTDGTTVLKDDNYIRESIYTPQVKVVAGYAGNMPSFQGQLDETQLNGIIVYMKTLSDRGGVAEGEPATDQPAELPAESTPDTAPEPSSSTDGGES